ncbi:hypothetical protein [Brevibacillus sp. NRS-1366]|uniref:hypothetical protein n=1 Tax=Brevibacillus sp. NRS-1366 TaxID=3233899 RepID=UPI003D1CC628
MKISGVAKGQYKQLCPSSWGKCNGDEKELHFKIQRAVALGKTVYTYKNGCKIKRYYHLNILTDGKEVMTIWRDKTTEPFLVSYKRKEKYRVKYMKEQSEAEKEKVSQAV